MGFQYLPLNGLAREPLLKGSLSQGILKGGSITVLLTSCLTGLDLVCFANKNKNCQLSYSWFQTNQTGGQLYNDTSPFSIPCLSIIELLVLTSFYQLFLILQAALTFTKQAIFVLNLSLQLVFLGVDYISTIFALMKNVKNKQVIWEREKDRERERERKTERERERYLQILNLKLHWTATSDCFLSGV